MFTTPILGTPLMLEKGIEMKKIKGKGKQSVSTI
jgi:hypothetical protein